MPRRAGGAMGEVVGAGLLAHVPTIMLPREQRLELNEGREISLVPGLERLRAEVFETLGYDTVVVLDSHWFTTVEFVVSAHETRAGLFTSDELPRGMCRIPYDWRGDPELAHAAAALGDRRGLVGGSRVGETMAEYRRILLDRAVPPVRREGEELVAGDGRRVSAAGAVHLPPVTPTKIIAVHLNHRSRVAEFQVRLPAAATYFSKTASALVGHGGAVVRPAGCKYLNYEGEVAIVIGRTCRGVPPSQAAGYIAGGTPSPTTSGCTTSAASGCAPTSTGNSRRTGPPTRCSGTCTTWSPTSRGRSRCARATCCCPGRRPTPAQTGRAHA